MSLLQTSLRWTVLRFLRDPAGLMAHGCCPEFVWTHVARGCNTWYIYIYIYIYKSWITPVPRGLSGCQHKFVHIISCWWCSGDSGGTPLIKLTNIPITQKFITDCDGPHRQIARWAVGLRPKEGLVLGTPYWMPGCHRRPCGRNASDVEYPLAGLRQGTWYFVNLYRLYIYTTFFLQE